MSIGYNAGNNCNILGNNTGCTFLGSNSNMAASNTSITNSTAIGIGSIINASNSIFLGRDLIDTTVCYALTTTNLTATNITATASTINNLNINGTTTFNYSSLSGLASYKNQGFSSAICD